MNDPVTRFKDIFNRLGTGSLHLLNELYAEDVRFIDPVHEVRGLDALRACFAKQYANTLECTFDFHEEFVRPQDAMLTWTMRLRHRRLDGGRLIVMAGASHLRFAERVNFHQDYFDLGAMIYERLPLVRGVIRWVRNRL